MKTANALVAAAVTGAFGAFAGANLDQIESFVNSIGVEPEAVTDRQKDVFYSQAEGDIGTRVEFYREQGVMTADQAESIITLVQNVRDADPDALQEQIKEWAQYTGRSTPSSRGYVLDYISPLLSEQMEKMSETYAPNGCFVQEKETLDILKRRSVPHCVEGEVVEMEYKHPNSAALYNMPEQQAYFKGPWTAREGEKSIQAQVVSVDGKDIEVAVRDTSARVEGFDAVDPDTMSRVMADFNKAQDIHKRLAADLKAGFNNRWAEIGAELLETNMSIGLGHVRKNVSDSLKPE